jgi:hypothetical protein
MDPQNNNPAQPDPVKQTSNNYYPQIEIERNINPNRLYAIPLFGFLVKIIILIPVFLELWLLFMAIEVLVFLVNPFVVLFTGKYLKIAYDLATGALRLGAKSSLYCYGVTDKYPGFDISTSPFTWNLAYPDSPDKLYAIPLLGIFIRVILIIPFVLFSQIISHAITLAAFFTFAPVLFKGYYPETTHELAVDYVRLSNASMAYVFGISDTYPSFKISWNHKTMKILLVIFGVLMLLGNLASSLASSSDTKTFQPNVPTPSINQTELPSAQAF